MAECEKLLRTAADLSQEANEIRTSLAKAVDDVERHLVSLPAIAQLLVPTEVDTGVFSFWSSLMRRTPRGRGAGRSAS